MKVSEAIRWGMKELETVGIERPLVDVRLLLAHAISQSLQRILAEDEIELSESQWDLFQSFMSRRADREPYAYIVGEKEFFGLSISVTPDVLIPRPETESLVEKFLEQIKALNIKSGRILDLGTGSGAIALALASKLPKTFEIIGIDFSQRALDCAKQNQRKLGIENLRFEYCDYIQNPESLIQLASENSFESLWIANPPYIPRIAFSQLEPEIRDHEPREALDGGEEGLDFYFSILNSYEKTSPTPALLAFETMGPWQNEKIRVLIDKRKSIFTEGPLFFVSPI